MKTRLMVPILLMTLGATARGQNQPVVNQPSFGFSLPKVEGTLTYALSGSQTFITGYGGSTGGTAYMSSLSGDLAYLSSSVSKPFSLVYSGGYLYFHEAGYPSNTTFQNVTASQVVTTKNWTFMADDGFSYMPDTPTTGLSGIPGLGDIGVAPVQTGIEPAQPILTGFSTQLGNGLTGEVTRTITGNLSMSGTGSWQILHFTGPDNIDSTEEMGSVGPTYRINANSSVNATVNYEYTKDSFQGFVLPFTTESIIVEYQKQLTPLLSINVSGGPQRTYGTGLTEALLPSQITMVGSAGLVYQRKVTSASVYFSRATNAGSGVVYGALTDTVAGVYNHQFNSVWQGALNGSWAKSTALAQVPGYDLNYDAAFGGAQISRSLGRSWSTYFSYTAEYQNAQGSGVLLSAFNGLEQVYALGVTFSPPAHHFAPQQ
ncbi:MAG: hypothetical protein ACLGQX_03280 [Acidobacteriota bacterium]